MNTNILITVNKSIETQLEHHCKKWRYDRNLFRIAAANLKMPCPAMPLFWTPLIEENKIITCKQATQQFLLKYTMNIISIHARLYQFHAAFLRELHCAMTLYKVNPFCEVIKNHWMDLNRNTDFTYKFAGKEINLAVCHRGQVSQNYRSKKKHKTLDKVTAIFADEKFYDVDVISEQQIKDAILM